MQTFIVQENARARPHAQIRTNPTQTHAVTEILHYVSTTDEPELILVFALNHVQPVFASIHARAATAPGAF